MTSTDNPLAPSNNGTTPIYAAAWNGHLEIVKVLMTSTANPLAPSSNGSTPIDAARHNGHLEIVELLIASSKKYWCNFIELRILHHISTKTSLISIFCFQ